MEDQKPIVPPVVGIKDILDKLDIPEDDDSLKFGFNPKYFKTANSTIDLLFMDDIKSSCPLGDKNLTATYHQN